MSITAKAPQAVWRDQVAVCSWLGSYVASSPEVLLQVEFLQELDALSDDRFDIVVRLGTCSANGRSAVKLGEVAFGLFAAPSYIWQHGQPQSVEELERYDVVVGAGLSGAAARGEWAPGAGSAGGRL